LEKISSQTTFQDVLEQCQETARKFEGLMENLQYILHVEAVLERLMAEMN
jgi:hypothetical protein